MLGGAWQGSQVNQGDQMLGALEGIIGGKPGQGQQLGISQAGSMNMGMNDPIMMMLQPVVDQLAAKVNIPPQIATIGPPSASTTCSPAIRPPARRPP